MSYKNFHFNEGPGKKGCACVTFVDGVPTYLNWFTFELDHEWMMTQLEMNLGLKFKLSDYVGGNGHSGADIEIIK